MHLIVHFAFVVTALLIVAYFLLLTASKAGGLIAAFGRVLGLWLLVLAAIIVGGIATAHLNGGKPYGMDFPMGTHHGWMHGYGPNAPAGPAPPPPAQPEPAPAPAAPPGG